ncbi:MAG: methionine adenosyltransferase [Sciscionella sp.]
MSMTTVFTTTDAMLCHPSLLPYEVVERKGIGHPDTIADGVAELASIRYSHYCLDQFGVIPHHNLDKVAICGGLARFDWKSGEYVRPLRVVFAGRASTRFGANELPVRDILEAAAFEQLRTTLPGFRHLTLDFHHLTTDSSMYDRWFRPRNIDDLPELSANRASDTAYLVASAPPTATEQVALESERFLRRFGWAGSDIKVMVVRHGTSFRVAACVPALVGAFADSDEYRKCADQRKT